ncbi:hypothetical protein GYA27_03060 [candidate division WWE3 bacterium]|uniref:DUF4870 domain-containing protein n=1 Tax=candidate division WWE3 bacterium TaxID=2053526 RepID=A0A7X9DKL0_UNCKA|nr:hypothetical protein [candidate division WWE3 bacterium]
MDEEIKNKTNTDNLLANFDPNVVAAFAYLFPFITGIVFFVLEKKNKFIRFHAFQAILFWLAFMIAWSLAQSLIIIFIGHVLEPLVRVAGILIWLFLMWKAYQNVEYELPYIGKIAKEQANKE